MDACDQIRNLIRRYAEAVDQGRFEVLDELFGVLALGAGAPGPGIEGRTISAVFGGGCLAGVWCGGGRRWGPGLA